MASTDFWYADPEFRLALHAAAPGLHRYDRHSHDEYSIILVTGGAKVLRVGPAVLRVAPGQIVIVSPGLSHDCEPLDDTAWSHRCWYVSAALAAEITGDARFATAPPKLRPVTDAPDLARALVAAHRAASEDRSVDREQSQLLLLARALEGAKVDRHDDEVAHNAAARRFPSYLSMIRDQMTDGLDLDALADEIGVSRFQVIRDIKATSNMTPSNLLRDIRLREAKRLMRMNVPSSEVSQLTGFADQSHFQRVFKGSYAITPGTYRVGTKFAETG
ncbi:MAG: AraC family transcriptional regulator [Pseudomonadota bacterium]